MSYCGIHLRTVSQVIIKITTVELDEKNSDIKLQPHLPEACELSCNFMSPPSVQRSRVAFLSKNLRGQWHQVRQWGVSRKCAYHNTVYFMFHYHCKSSQIGTFWCFEHNKTFNAYHLLWPLKIANDSHSRIRDNNKMKCRYSYYRQWEIIISINILTYWFRACFYSCLVKCTWPNVSSLWN